MARTTDLGWLVARCDGIDLDLLSPASADDPAASMTVQGTENILALRDLLNDALADHDQQKELGEEG